jgi:hypothetical protein
MKGEKAHERRIYSIPLTLDNPFTLCGIIGFSSKILEKRIVVAPIEVTTLLE